MEDDKTPATPRKRAAKAKPNDTANPSVAAESTATGASTPPGPRKIPPATFVSPPGPDRQAADPPRRPTEPTRQRAAPIQNPSDAGPPSTASPAASPPPARKATGKTTGKVAKKAVNKAPAAAPPPQDAAPPRDTPPPQDAPPPLQDTLPVELAPPAETPVPAAPAQRATRAPAKKIARKAAPKAATPKKTTPAVTGTSATPPQKIAEPAALTAPAASTAPAQPTAPAASTAPAQPTAPTEPPAPVPPAQPAAPLLPIINANPGYATELLALAAVERIGPHVRAHLTWLRDTYRTAATGGLVRIATSRSVRQARTQGAVAGLLGPLAVLAQTGALLWTQSRLVLDIAAAYGRDPADPERAVELLMLLRVHPDLAAAREAVAAAREATANGPGEGGDRSPQVPLPLVRLAGRALVRMTTARRAARLVPGAGAALTAILDARATEQVAARATKFYRG